MEGGGGVRLDTFSYRAAVGQNVRFLLYTNKRRETCTEQNRTVTEIIVMIHKVTPCCGGTCERVNATGFIHSMCAHGVYRAPVFSAPVIITFVPPKRLPNKMHEYTLCVKRVLWRGYSGIIMVFDRKLVRSIRTCLYTHRACAVSGSELKVTVVFNWLSNDQSILSLLIIVGRDAAAAACLSAVTGVRVQARRAPLGEIDFRS